MAIQDKPANIMLEVYRCTACGYPSFLWEFFKIEVFPYTKGKANLFIDQKATM